METERSFEPILVDDLEMLALIAYTDRVDFFSRHHRRENFLFSALCQGAAQHYLDGNNGIKDIDVWSFHFYRRLRPRLSFHAYVEDLRYAAISIPGGRIR